MYSIVLCPLRIQSCGQDQPELHAGVSLIVETTAWPLRVTVVSKEGFAWTICEGSWAVKRKYGSPTTPRPMNREGEYEPRVESNMNPVANRTPRAAGPHVTAALIVVFIFIDHPITAHAHYLPASLNTVP
jgi:hypothetical protein